jgi:hypothetical protein
MTAFLILLDVLSILLIAYLKRRRREREVALARASFRVIRGGGLQPAWAERAS